MSMRTVGIVGAGQMGAGIAHVAALAGFDVILTDIETEVLKRGLESIGHNLDRQIKKGSPERPTGATSSDGSRRALASSTTSVPTW